MANEGEQMTMVVAPLIIMFRSDEDEKIACHLHPPADYTHRHYGLLIADIVRHVAAMYSVPENDVWEWVDKERNKPTTELVTVKEAFPKQ